METATCCAGLFLTQFCCCFCCCLVVTVKIQATSFWGVSTQYTCFSSREDLRETAVWLQQVPQAYIQTTLTLCWSANKRHAGGLTDTISTVTLSPLRRRTAVLARRLQAVSNRTSSADLLSVPWMDWSCWTVPQVCHCCYWTTLLLSLSELLLYNTACSSLVNVTHHQPVVFCTTHSLVTVMSVIVCNAKSWWLTGLHWFALQSTGLSLSLPLFALHSTGLYLVWHCLHWKILMIVNLPLLHCKILMTNKSTIICTANSSVPMFA